MTEFRKINELPTTSTLTDSDLFIVETLTGTKAVTRSALREETQITPADIGLGNVDNTHDLDKPVSNAMASALLGKVDTSIFNTTLQDFLTKIDAASTYLTQNNASGTYLSKIDAVANYETKLDHGTDMATKQDIINDLATIRAGATAGSTAVQPEELADVATSGDYDDLDNKPINISTFTNDVGYLTQHQDISGKANASDLSEVAFSGSYNDLSNKPVIPLALSQFTDDLGSAPIHTHNQYLTTGTYTVLTTTTQTVLGAINEVNGLLEGVEELLSEV